MPTSPSRLLLWKLIGPMIRPLDICSWDLESWVTVTKAEGNLEVTMPEVVEEQWTLGPKWFCRHADPCWASGCSTSLSPLVSCPVASPGSWICHFRTPRVLLASMIFVKMLCLQSGTCCIFYNSLSSSVKIFKKQNLIFSPIPIKSSTEVGGQKMRTDYLEVGFMLHIISENRAIYSQHKWQWMDELRRNDKRMRLFPSILLCRWHHYLWGNTENSRTPDIKFQI